MSLNINDLITEVMNQAPRDYAKEYESYGRALDMMFDYMINLADQVRILAETCRNAGIPVPEKIGIIERSSEEVIMRSIREIMEKRLSETMDRMKKRNEQKPTI